MSWLSLPAADGLLRPNDPAGTSPRSIVAQLGRIGLVCIMVAVAVGAGMFSPSIGASGHMTSIAEAMPDAAVTLVGVLSAIFAGALVSGLAGFAFSAVAGTLLLRLIEPAETVSLLLVCSLGAQLVSMANLRGSIAWREVLPLVAAGLAGIPVGTYVLQVLPASMFAAAFGIFLVGYSAVMLVRPALSIRCRSRIPALLSGFAGGITGGAIAFPGAIPTIWCTIQDLSKDSQRALVQPFIVIMQIATIAYFSGIGILTAEALLVSLVCAPAVLAGTWLGLWLYRRFSDAEFRRLVFVVLLICGAMLL
jgi:uncharacterized membrane protein YfcA